VAKVAVLGLGRMGAALARKLATAGHHVTGWNRTPEVTSALVTSFATAGPSNGSLQAGATPAATVDGASVVIAMLANGTITQQVLLDETVLAALAPDAIVCDMGTSGVATAEALAAIIRARGRSFVDAPVSGSVPTVDAGQLLIMAGGSVDEITRAAEVLSAFAKQVIHTGGVGTGQAMKLAVNLIVHDLNAAVSEGLLLATRSGISAEVAYDVFQSSVIGAPFVQYKRAAFLNNDVPVAMSLGLVEKDLTLIVDQADRLGVAANTTRAVLAEVSGACVAGYGTSDMAALARHLGVISG
jgi:3-hydroxyisobutyrate dehydrogenase